jgi:ribosome-associated protein
MEDTSLEDRAGWAETARALGELLREHKGGEVTVLDLRGICGWTDFFVIATVTSGAHLQGLERYIKEFARQRGVEIFRRSRKPPAGAGAVPDEWCLVDLGAVVVHLMSAQARSFYGLERLWSAAPAPSQSPG